jgi:alpha-glucosidase
MVARRVDRPDPAVPAEWIAALKHDWWRHGVVYQIYPRSFQDSDDDGVGDLPGIIRRLDYLNDGSPDSLGVDAIWLSPFYPSPMADFGYDVSDYRDVHPMFGTLADFDRLVAGAHDRGMRIVIDLVPNHTSDQHPWFVEARSSRDNPKRDWYVWADPKPDGSPPNNWRSAFERVGRAWTLDPRTGQYYLHLFMPQQPDLNWWNPEVRRAMDDVLRFWLDRGVDGFRVDVAAGMIKDRELRDNPRVHVGRRAGRRDVDQPEVLEIHRAFRRTLDEYGDRMAVGEIGYSLEPRYVSRYYGAGDLLHLSFNFAFLLQPWRAEAFRRVVGWTERFLPAGSWPTYTLSNHDRPRLASRYGPDQARAAAMLVLTLRGTPFIYYGDELGMRDVPIPTHRAVDVDGRDPERTPMQWDASANAGFTSGRPWLPIARDYRRVNVAVQRRNSGSMLNLYRRLIWYRKRSSALRWGGYRPMRTPDGIFAYVRESEDERLLVALNFWGRARRLVLDAQATSPTAQLEISTDPSRSATEVSLRPLALGPHEGLVLRLP